MRKRDYRYTIVMIDNPAFVKGLEGYWPSFIWDKYASNLFVCRENTLAAVHKFLTALGYHRIYGLPEHFKDGQFLALAPSLPRIKIFNAKFYKGKVTDCFL